MKSFLVLDVTLPPLSQSKVFISVLFNVFPADGFVPESRKYSKTPSFL